MRIWGRNVCPRNKPHLRKMGSIWVQHWPDGWKQYIATWGGAVPKKILPRHPYEPQAWRL